MPTYDYRCEKGHTFELFHSISDETPKLCPECGGEGRKVPAGGGGFLFKGSGFYITDYRSKGYRDAARRESPGSGGDKGGSGGSGGSGTGGGGSSGGAGGGTGG